MHELRSFSPKCIDMEFIAVFMRRSKIEDSQCSLSQSVSVFINNNTSFSIEIFVQNATISFIIQT